MPAAAISANSPVQERSRHAHTPPSVAEARRTCGPDGVCSALNQSISAAMPIMIAIPAAKTTHCRRAPPRNSLITRRPIVESRIPRQKTCSECRPHMMNGRAARPARNVRLGRDQARDEQGEYQHVGETQRRQIRLAQQGPQRLAEERGEWVVEPMQRPAEADQEPGKRASQPPARTASGW